MPANEEVASEQSDAAECAAACNDVNTASVAEEGVLSCSSTADVNDSSAAASLDPYSYVHRGDYTSEVYKLELMNLPKRFGIAVS